MDIDDYLSNEAVGAELGRRIKDARIAFPLTQLELARRAGVSQRTIANLEKGAEVTMGSLVSVLRALGLLSRMDLLVPKAEVRPTKLVDQVPKRQRATSPKYRKKPATSWKWGDEK